MAPDHQDPNRTAAVPRPGMDAADGGAGSDGPAPRGSQATTGDWPAAKLLGAFERSALLGEGGADGSPFGARQRPAGIDPRLADQTLALGGALPADVLVATPATVLAGAARQPPAAAADGPSSPAAAAHTRTGSAGRKTTVAIDPAQRKGNSALVGSLVALVVLLALLTGAYALFAPAPRPAAMAPVPLVVSQQHDGFGAVCRAGRPCGKAVAVAVGRFEIVR